MKLSELFLNRYLYRDNDQDSETKDATSISADSSDDMPVPVSSGGSAQDINTGGVDVDGDMVDLGISSQTWQHNITFSVIDADTVAWTSGTITFSGGSTNSISAGNTGDMTAVTYIYLDTDVSATVLQTSTASGDAVGGTKILICIATPDLNSRTSVVAYEAVALPAASTPVWHTGGNNSPTEEISPAGILHILCDTGPPDEDYWTTINSGYSEVPFNTTTGGFSVKIRIRIDQGKLGFGGNGIDLMFNNNGGGDLGGAFGFFTDGVALWDDALGGVSHSMDTTDDYHTYEAVINSDTGKVRYYIDDVFVMENDAETSSDPFGWGDEQITFKATDGSDIDEVQIDYIRTSTNVNGYDPTLPVEQAAFQVFNRIGLSGAIENGTADGQMSYWDNLNSVWRHTEVDELFWNDTNKTLRLGNLYKAMSSESVADDASINIPPLVNNSIGWGTVMAGDNTHWAIFSWTAAGAVTIEDSKGSVVNTDTDANLCIIDAGTKVAIKNRIGTTQIIRYEITYS